MTPLKSNAINQDDTAITEAFLNFLIQYMEPNPERIREINSDLLDYTRLFS